MSPKLVRPLNRDPKAAPGVLGQEVDLARAYAPSIVATIREPLLLLDTNLRVRSANQSFYGFFRVSPEETVGRPIYELGLGQWNIAKLRSLLENILPSHSHFENFEVEYDFPMIGQKIILLNAQRVQAPQEPQEPMILLAMEDITEHKLLRDRDKAIQARDEMIGVVAHELKNPLAAIITTVDLLKRTLPTDERLDQSKRLLGTIRTAVDRMNRITSDLLDVSKIEAGRLMLGQTEVAVSELVGEVESLAAPLASEKAIELSQLVEPENLKVNCDRDRIFQVLFNLVGNAIKFTSAGGKVEIFAKSIVGGAVRFQVKDTGKGIPESELPFVFDRFWQAKHAQYVGAGLGLYIARGIIEAHGGRVWVNSKVGQGTAFFFDLPT